MESSSDGSIQIRFDSHPSEDSWEEYAYGRTDPVQTARLEEHLLACPACQATLDRADNFISMMRSAGPVAVESASGFSWVMNSFKFLLQPRVAAGAFAAAAVSVFVIAAIPGRTQKESTPAVVALASFRGAEGASAPAGRPLEFTISEGVVPLAGGYRLEVVTSSGDPVWKGKLSARVAEGLSSGRYWVRLFEGTKLVQEFGLRVE